MGIIILPFLLGALVIAFLAIIDIIKLIKAKEVSIKELILGLILSLSIFGLIVLSYLIQGEVWALSTVFRIPIFMVFIPYIIHKRTKNNIKVNIKYISKLLLISIGVTGILSIVFYDLFFGLFDYIGIKETY